MDAETAKAKESLAKFEGSLSELEEAVRPVLTAVDEIRTNQNVDDLDAMTRARLHITLGYSVNVLFCMYLRTQGIDPETHPVMDELSRVQEAFMRMRKVEAGMSAGFQPPPNRDRRKHIEKIQRSEAKLSALIFPEEGDLVRALRNLKRIEKKEGNTGGEENDDEDELGHIRTNDGELEEIEQMVEKKERKAVRKEQVKEHKEKKRELKIEKQLKKKRKRSKKKKA